MEELLQQAFVPYVALGLAALGFAVSLAAAMANRDGLLRGKWDGYVGHLEKELRFLHSSFHGKVLAFGQVGMAVALLLATLVTTDAIFVLFIPFVAFGPVVMLQRKHTERVLRIEKQLDVWLVALSSALKAAPSLGSAIESSAALTQKPLQDELNLVIKEMKLGSPLDEALREMASRLGSRTLWGAVATLLVARRTGGNVSAILDQSAASLREMARLDGIVQAKTAEGKSQALVLGGIPFVLLLAIHAMDNSWLAPLTSTALGFVVIGVASVMWLFGFILARRILAVDV